MFYPWLPIIPFLPSNCEKPPTLYSLLEAKLNFGAEDENKIKIKHLAKEGASFIFDFDYPLSTNINKEKFETMIINHFLMRRIGYETFTAFQIALNVKMNEIMPYYNILLDSLNGWNLFNDGENITRKQEDTRTNNTKQNGTNNSNIDNTDELKYSNTPQNNLTSIQNGEYLTEYNYNTTNNTQKNNFSNTSDSTDKGNLTETINRTPADKIELYKKFMNETNKIYSMLFQDLDVLFYQLV